MKTDIEKIFQLLQSDDEANHALAMQLVKSQNLDKYPLYRHQGLVTHHDMLDCLKYIESKTSGSIFKQRLLQKMYTIANEMMEFIKYYNTEQASFSIAFNTQQEKLQIAFKLTTTMTRAAINHLETKWNKLYTEHQKHHSHYILIVYSKTRLPQEYFSEDENKPPYDWTQWVTILKSTGVVPHFSSQPCDAQHKRLSATVVLPCNSNYS